MAILKIEAGKILLDDDMNAAGGGYYHSLLFRNNYSNPVVIAYIMTEAGGDPIDARVRNVESTGCQIFMEEWKNSDHNDEWISYLVVESGIFELPDGTKMEAGSLTIPATSIHSAGENPTTTGNYETITFTQTFTSSPSFFATLNTHNNHDFMSVGSKDVTTTEAKIYQERSRSTQTPSSEVAGWLAIDTGKAGTFLEDVTFETGRFNDGSNDGKPDNAHVVNYVNTYTEPPLFFAHGVTMNDTQGYWARGVFWGLHQSNVDAEEPDDGSNLSHSDEVFSHIIFSKPFDFIYSPGIGIVTSERKRNVWVDDPYVYKASSEGLAVYNLASEALINFINFPGGFNSVWSNDQYIYVGTSMSGVYRHPVSTISGTDTFHRYKSFPDLTANDVNYVHGSEDYLCIATVSGVDRYIVSSDTREYDIFDNVPKCYQTSNGDYYFIVNPFENILGLDHSLFAWKYGREVTLSHPIPEDNYSFYFEIPADEYPFSIYSYAAEGGIDIRIVDDTGNRVPHYIQSWNNVTSPEIWVKLSAGVSKFYILYGNNEVSGRSDPEEVFRLFDDFDGSTLSDKWSFDNAGSTSNTYTVADGKLTMICFNNATISFTSTNSYYGGMIEYYYRRTSTNDVGDLDYFIQFVGGTYVYIGIGYVSDHETPHRLSASGQTIQGTKPTITSFRQHTIIESENYQSSEYDGELLEVNGTMIMGYRTIKFGMNDNSTQPNIEIDWIRARNYDPNPPTYVFDDNKTILTLFDTTELHAVYEAGGGHIYSSSQYGVINSSYITDLHITEGTSTYDEANVIFLATSWGAVVLEERRGDEDNCTKRVYLLAS